LPLSEVVIRLLGAAAVGTALGLNRDLRHKPAGVRTHALVGIGAALAVIVTLRLGPTGGSDGAAVSRVVQGIITGIGFLGAGVILRPGERTVRGLTTAATIWVTAALGIACGIGAWRDALVTTALVLTVLVLGGPLERLTHRLVGNSGSKPPAPSPTTAARPESGVRGRGDRRG
jgi:putative Mg2+ transporter-C (MgtC) family protein